MAHPPFSVIIPAHNEEAVIARCLKGILATAPMSHAMQIIVAANGCSDRTVECARRAAPDAEIVDIASSSKTAAINAANAIAQHFPRIYLDADVECDFRTLATLAGALTDGDAMTAAPAIKIDLSRATPLIRAYFRVWQRQPYALEGKGGAGCYALSQAALETLGEFPDIIADDAWVHTRFPDDQKRFVSVDAEGNAVFTKVHPPRTAIEQIKVEARRQLGNRELQARHPGPYPFKSGGGGLGVAVRSGASLPDITVFFAIKASARLLARWRLARGHARIWTRDTSSREP